MGTSALIGRLIVQGEIEALTGLRVGGAMGGLSIGTVDLPVIRDQLSGKPYIPGSSLKGKMRSLGEKYSHAESNKSIGKDVSIHVAKTLDDYNTFWVNPIFGVAPADGNYTIPAPNRLIVRDVKLSDTSAQRLLDAKTDQPYTEIKWEAAIDRVTSAAAPRQIERVPAGAVFSPMELVFSLYLPDDHTKLFPHLITCLQLVEDDYLGGHGSRGSGKVAFRNLKLAYKHGDAYKVDESPLYPDLAALNDSFATWLAAQIKA